MPVSRDRGARKGRALACIAFALLFAAFPAFRASADAIQHTTNEFVFTAGNSIVTVSDTNGSILSVTESGQGGTIAYGGEFGLWSETNEDGSSFDAAEFSAGSSSNSFSWTLAPSGNALTLAYSNAAIAVNITITNGTDGVDLTAQVWPRTVTVLDLNLPGRMRFLPSNLQRLICPLSSSDGGGAAFNGTFFASQPETNPASWAPTMIGSAGYVSLYGGSLIFGPNDEPPSPVAFTSEGTNWLGADLAVAWTGSNAIVNRAPAAGQADLILVNSTNGAYFSASHLGGNGYLFRLGGEVDTNIAPLAQALVIAAVEHLAQTPAPGRTNVALLNLAHGPISGGWAAVPVSTWSNLLGTSAVLAQAGIQVVELPTVQAMLDALADTSYLAVVNPYGEWIPTLESLGVTESVSAVGEYVRRGGNWFETGGYSFYYELLPQPFYSYNTPYPPAFADFLQIESAAGTASIYGVQPAIYAPWAGSNNPAAVFVPGRLAWGGDELGGYCERGFGTYVAPGQTWQSPVVRLTVGSSAADALSAYSAANAYSRGLADKMPPSLLNAFENSVLVLYAGTCAEKIAHLSELPSPALVHFSDYLTGGFDKEYPDYLPPNAAFGTPSDFTNFLGQAHQLGLLLMPYTNPTWWCIDPEGPTFLSDGTAPLLVELGGSLSYEVYGTNTGYTVCQWHPDDQAANQRNVGEFTTNYPVDVLFEDQCGARGWGYDMNPASPTPWAYSDGIASREGEDSQTLPISTEDGWDRLVNVESQFCGMAWSTVPTINPPTWQSFLSARYTTTTWDLFPVAEYIAHDKVSFVLHDLGQFVTGDEQLAWTLGLGYGMSYVVGAADLDTPSIRQWLLWLDRVQKSICVRYVGQPLTAFSHEWGTNGDNGFIQTSYGQLSILANLSPQSLTVDNQTLAPFGFYATAPGLVGGNIPGSTTGNSFVVETNGANAQFWVYTTGEQNVGINIPFGPGGPASVQLDGHSPNLLPVENTVMSVPLGMTPTQDRIQPPPALAGLAPSNWPSKPSIGILDLAGMPSSWTTISADNWAEAFSESSLATQYDVPIIEITNFSGLTAALQAGPAAWFAIVNPCGEVFPESAQGQWPATLNLISNYVNNGGSWWETAGYSFYASSWFESNEWQAEIIGPSGMDTFGLPVGGGSNTQPPEPLTVTATGQTMFGPILAAQLQGLSSTVNRGLLRSSPDPGHITLLAGAQQDFMGAYRLGGWGYLWRIGGFFPNPAVVLRAVPAAMEYLYTNAPLPALVSSVQYLWHGTVTFPSRPILQASVQADGSVSFVISNCPAGGTNYLERSSALNDPTSWQTILTFSSPLAQTNLLDLTAPGLPRAFYRVRTSPGP
jgi:hypothetical protein